MVRKPKKLKCPTCKKRAIHWHKSVRWMCDNCWRTYHVEVLAKHNKLPVEEVEARKGEE